MKVKKVLLMVLIIQSFNLIGSALEAAKSNPSDREKIQDALAAFSKNWQTEGAKAERDALYQKAHPPGDPERNLHFEWFEETVGKARQGLADLAFEVALPEQLKELMGTYKVQPLRILQTYRLAAKVIDSLGCCSSSYTLPNEEPWVVSPVQSWVWRAARGDETAFNLLHCFGRLCPGFHLSGGIHMLHTKEELKAEYVSSEYIVRRFAPEGSSARKFFEFYEGLPKFPKGPLGERILGLLKEDDKKRGGFCGVSGLEFDPEMRY